MKYLLLDTNIYVDMIISRDKIHNANLFENFLKLLDSKKIKLIVPSVVKTETFRHINEEINSIGTGLKTLSTNINNLHWINKTEELDKFNKDLFKLKEGVNSLKGEFEKKVDFYETHYQSLFNKIFENENSIIVDENIDIILKAQKREIHKKRPYHYRENKDSIADAIIVETLISIGDLIELNDDIIYFVSKNKKDFSEENNENMLHKDILDDIKEKSKFKNIEYRLNFASTLFKEFNEEIKEVGIEEELRKQYEDEMNALKKEFEEEQIALKEEHYAELLNYERESCGLSALGNDDEYEQRIAEISKIENLIQQLEEIKKIFNDKFDEFSDNYYDLDEYLSSKTSNDLKDILKKNPLFNLFIDNTEEDSWSIKYDILKCFENIIGNEDYASFLTEVECNDYFSLNESIFSFTDNHNNKYELKTEGILIPRDGDINDVFIELSKNTKVIARSRIEVNYGYCELDSDGKIGDGCAEGIDIFNIEEIYTELNKMSTSVITEVNTKIEKIKQMKNILVNKN
ncbi:PIN domain-containing protein [Clostridium perfringens]|uniref:PIN domain-containing protein n=1 Tax=Clostridium perfringens TaxID=1502 RepID=UPI0008A6DF35|nr:PIN domain-containing protein [Clostridium perfringens]AOY53681.1 hypothetical protein FORC25_1265 [Clostridium perfringens]HBI7336941.1 DUF4935 domain-containing protein [Clostridium perfringens]